LKEILTVALGGAIGAVVRFSVAKMLQQEVLTFFPLGIFLVNISGCLLMGFLATLFMDIFAINQFWRLLLLVGFLGGYTTFSGFTIDVFNMLKYGMAFQAFAYVAASVILCLLATWIGIFFAGLLK
jgi:fluoride exporter